MSDKISFDLNISGMQINITITVKQEGTGETAVLNPQISQSVDLSHSSFIQCARYNSQTRYLDIELKSGALYRYDDVPQWVFDSISEASSPGEFFTKKVKPFYNCEKL